MPRRATDLRPRRRPHRPGPAALESRVLLSNVSVEVDDDEIEIEGTDGDESITITAVEGGFTITGVDGTTVEGREELFVPFSGVPEELEVDLEDGFDSVEFVGVTAEEFDIDDTESRTFSAAAATDDGDEDDDTEDAGDDPADEGTTDDDADGGETDSGDDGETDEETPATRTAIVITDEDDEGSVRTSSLPSETTGTPTAADRIGLALVVEAGVSGRTFEFDLENETDDDLDVAAEPVTLTIFGPAGTGDEPLAEVGSLTVEPDEDGTLSLILGEGEYDLVVTGVGGLQKYELEASVED